MTIRHVTADEVTALLTPRVAVAALRQALLDGFDPADDVARSSVALPYGEMLVMPSATGDAVGIKVLTVAPPGHQDGPRIQGEYLLFDAHTLAAEALVDGAALTSVRTAAVSMTGVVHLLTASQEQLDVVVFGTGEQARSHARAVHDVIGSARPVRITHVSRTPADGLDAWCRAGGDAARQAVGRAGLVLCTTTSSTPVVDRADVRDDVVVVAVGSHSPDAREVGSELMGEAQVVVEARATALRECGDVVLAVAEGRLDPGRLVTLRDVVRGTVALEPHRPVVFKTSGMSWEDLVLARAVVDAA